MEKNNFFVFYINTISVIVINNSRGIKMQVNFNSAVNYSNINFKALSKASEKRLRKDIEHFDDNKRETIEEQIKIENEKTNRTIKLSPYKWTDKKLYYYPVKFRKATIIDHERKRSTETTFCCDEPESFSAIVAKANAGRF